MPTIHFTCQSCGLDYTMVIFGDDTAQPHCPKCKSIQAKPLPRSERLFNGIPHFSTLAKDTN